LSVARGTPTARWGEVCRCPQLVVSVEAKQLADLVPQAMVGKKGWRKKGCDPASLEPCRSGWAISLLFNHCTIQCQQPEQPSSQVM